MNYVTVPKYLWDYTYTRALPNDSLGDVWIFLIVLGVIFTYTVGVGICQALIGKSLENNGGGLVWPFVLPYLFGRFIVESVEDWRATARIPQARTLEKK